VLVSQYISNLEIKGFVSNTENIGSNPSSGPKVFLVIVTGNFASPFPKPLIVAVAVFVGALAVASYVTFVLWLLFWVMGVVSGIDFGVIVGVTMISSIILLASKK